MLRLDASSADGQLASLAEMALGCGVLPPCGEVLRGLLRPAVCLVAIDRTSKVVSCAASSAYAHEDHPNMADRRGGACLLRTLRGVDNGCLLFLGRMLCLRWKHASDFVIS